MLAEAVLLVLLLSLSVQSGPTCASVAECRQQALDAAARGDYETFHDLAWRAMQKAKPNDSDVMYLLARAQALSGRPGDALVMLQRLRDLGVTTDAETNDDFRRVRALKGWADFLASPPPAAAPAASAPAPPAPATPSSARAVDTAPSAPATPARSSLVPETALTFDAKSLDPVGLAYDAVSRRFLVGDRSSARLIVVDEMSHHVTNLVSAASADFLARISGFAIDAKRGDLWVASTDEQASALHKLQLVSGRVLMKATTAAEDAPARFEDLVVSPDGTVLALDATGGRVFRLRAGARELEVAQQLGVTGARTIAPGNGSTFYVASDDNVLRVDVGRGNAAPLKAPEGTMLAGIRTLRWYDGGMLALQQTETGARLIRIVLRGADTVRRVEVIDASLPPATAGTVSGESFFYLAEGGAIRQVPLR